MARFTCGVVLFALALAMLPGCGSDRRRRASPARRPAARRRARLRPEQPAVDPNQPYASDQDIEVEGYKIRIPAGFTPAKDEKEGDGTVREWNRSAGQSSATVRLIVGPVSDTLDPAKIAATTAAEMKKLFKKVAYLEDDDAILSSLSGRVQYYSGVNEEDKPEEGTWYGLRDKDHVIGMTVRRVGSENEIPMPQLHAILRTFHRATDQCRRSRCKSPSLRAGARQPAARRGRKVR